MKRFWWHEQRRTHVAPPQGGPIWLLYDWQVNAGPHQHVLGEVAFFERTGVTFQATIWNDDNELGDVTEHFKTLSQARTFIEDVMIKLHGPCEFNPR